MNKATDSRVEREARLRWIPIAQMKAPPLAQRELNKARVDYLAENLDLEQIGTPTVSERDGTFWIIDGNHRITALELIGWGDQKIQCWTYTDLTEAEEAEKFLKLNDVLAVSAFDRFTKGVNAGRTVEVDIDRIVRGQGLVVSRNRIPGSINAVGTLRRIYTRSGAKVLSRTLKIIRDAYGDPGLESSVLDGIAMLCDRYTTALDDTLVIARLSAAHGGVNGLLNKAEVLRQRTGNAKGQCVAAAAVEIYNVRRGGKKLPSWWQTDV